MKQILSALIPAAFLVLFASCTSSIYRDMYPTLLDGRYDSEFPYRDCSEQLENVAETITRITVMAHYKTYSFPRGDSVRRSSVTKEFLDGLEPIAAYRHYSSAGTGTIIYKENNRIGVLTCAHIVDYTDTIVSPYLGPDYRVTPFIRSIAIKTNQLMFLNEVIGGTSLEILAFDRATDLAVLGQQLEENRSPLVKVFRYPLGRARQLEWGSFVYLFGYPSGYRMVTKGIVSLSGRPTPSSFFVDAVVSPGSSGSIALAIRDGVPNFELVGIIKMIPAQISYLLAPENVGSTEYDPSEPYHGEVFVQRKPEIQQGIAVAIPIETVVTFLYQHQGPLSQKGYDIVGWLNPPKPPLKN
jgi:S1-C subfamily serine protease